MGLIINNYPNITDTGDIVTINPNTTISLASTLIDITDIVSTSFLGSFVNVVPSTVNIGNSGGTLIFYGGQTPITRPGAITDATPATAHDVVNDILNVLRNFNLIAT